MSGKRAKTVRVGMVVALGVVAGVVLLGATGIAVLSLAWGAAHRPSTPVTVNGWTGGMVDRPGTYTMMDGTTFRVSDQDGLVRFSMEDRQGATLLHPHISPSAYSRWHFFLDDKRRLWFYSGDIGTYVWMEKAGGYEVGELSGRESLAKEMPREFFSRLGSSSQRVFGQHP